MALLETDGGMGFVLSEDKEVMDLYFRIPNTKELKSLGIKTIFFEADSFEKRWMLMRDWLLGELDDELGKISKLSTKGAHFRYIVTPRLGEYLLIDPGVENEDEWGENLVEICEWYAEVIEIHNCTFIKVSLLFCDFALSRITTIGYSNPLPLDEVISLDWSSKWRQDWAHQTFALIDIEDYQKKNGFEANIQEELDSKFEVPVPSRREFKSFYSRKRATFKS